MHKFMFFERKSGLTIDAHSLIMEDNNPVQMIPKRDLKEVLDIPRDVIALRGCIFRVGPHQGDQLYRGNLVHLSIWIKNQNTKERRMVSAVYTVSLGAFHGFALVKAAIPCNKDTKFMPEKLSFYNQFIELDTEAEGMNMIKVSKLWMGKAIKGEPNYGITVQLPLQDWFLDPDFNISLTWMAPCEELNDVPLLNIEQVKKANDTKVQEEI